MVDDDEVPSEDDEGDGLTRPQITPDDDNSPSDEQECDDQIPPQEVADDDAIPCKDQKGDKHILPILDSGIRKYACLRKQQRPISSTRGIVRSRYLSVS